MMNFEPARNQDASHTINGFKYQIQLTLLRWLSLAVGEVLFLECGEDIDRVLHGDSISALRELEQIKARGRNVTLRTPEVLTALANFAAHIIANPGMELKFRFTTTATAGREKLSPFEKGQKGIEVWQALQAKNQWTVEDDAAITTMGQFLREIDRPEECPVDSWQVLISITSNTGPMAFAEFVQRFEWSLGAVNSNELKNDIVQQLRARYDGSDADELPAAQRYNHLVAYLLELLSRPGEKKLTTELLTQELSNPTLTETDRARLTLLEEHTASQDVILETLQSSVRRLESNADRLTAFAGVSATVDAIEASPLSLPPPLVMNVSRRTETTGKISDDFASPKWMSIHGDFGTGKSHLGFLIAERLGGMLFGASFRSLSLGAAEQGLYNLMADPATARAIDSAPPGVVILDDLPEFGLQSRFEMLMAAFAKRILASGRSLISTSRRPLPSSVSQNLDDGLKTLTVPAFSDSDALELFRAHNVSEELLTPQRVSSMNATCAGHPMLLTALARHLRAHSDSPNEALLNALLANQHRTDIDLETARAVVQTIEVDTCRNLLYRLASAFTPMNLDEIRQLAAVEPALLEPTSCVARLDGLWLRRNSRNQFEISPLTTPLAREVPSSVNKALHDRVALIIFSRRRLSPVEFVSAIRSLLIAEQYEFAAIQLIRGALIWKRRDVGYSELGMLLFFPPGKANNLAPSTEIPLRGLQAISAAADRTDAGEYLRRIKEIIVNPTEEVAAGALFAGATILASSIHIPTSLAVFGASLIERFRTYSHLPRDLPLFVSEGDTGLIHLVLPMAQIRNWEALESFVDLMASLSASRRDQLKAFPDFRHGLQTIVFGAMFSESGDLSEGAWLHLDRLQKRARELGLAQLGAYALAGKLIILAEYQKNPGAMVAEGTKALAEYANDPIAIAVIESTIGQQLSLADRGSEALPFLNRALENPAYIVGMERALRLVDALTAAWQSNADIGRITRELAAMITGKEIVSEEMLCQLNAQVAVAHWRLGERALSLFNFERSVAHFSKLKDSVRMRQLGAALGHSLNYCATIAESGELPILKDGSSYSEGIPQMFSGTRKAMADMWRPRQGGATLQWMLGRLADALGNVDAAAVWSDRALESAMRAKSSALLSLLAPRAVIASVKKSSWADAIEAAMIHGRARVFTDQKRREGISSYDEDLKFEPLENPVGQELRQIAEEHALWILSRVFVVELANSIELLGESAGHAMTALANELDKFAMTATLSNAWAHMASIVRKAASAGLTENQINDALTVSTLPGMENVVFLAHGLLSFQPGATLRQAATSHIGVFYDIRRLPEMVSFPIDAFGEAIAKYWGNRIEGAAFQFSAPREVAKVIKEANAKAPIGRAKMILSEVLNSLSLTVSNEVRDWLKQL